jgi:23S rRNA pseudouridine1911/1915/1917 synthase
LTTNEDHYDRGLLNRLDSETSGVLIYFKNSHYHQQARDNFQTMVIKKIYLAKVFGACPLLGRLQDHLIISDQKVSVDTDGEAHSVLAQLEILSSNYDAKTNTSELKIGLMTGVRHQIRVQLGSRGFPIIGDQLYGGHSADRLYLHALLYHLKLAEKILEFHSPVGTSWTRTVLAI